MKLGMAHVNAATYWSRLDAQAVLDHYGAQNCRREQNRDGTTEVIHSCLLDRVEPHHAHGDTSPSASCNLEKKLYVCYSYWGGDLLHLIQKMERTDTVEDIAPVLGQFLDDPIRGDDLVVKIRELLATAEVIGRQRSVYSPRILAPWGFIHPYLAERGIDNDTASKLQIGWDESVNRITIPHFWKGALVGWQTRAIPDRPGQWPGTVPDTPKYKSNAGFPKSDTLYGRDLVTTRDEVIVVESPFSVIKAHALGIPNVVATFGAKVSGAQIDLLKDFRRGVCVWMDNDSKSPAGRLAERRLVTALHRHTRVSVVIPEVDKDLADCCTAQEVHRKLAVAEPAVFALMRYEQEGRQR
jgi:Toprim domain